MSGLDAMARRVNQLARATSNTRLEEQWQALCSGAKDDLLAWLAQQCEKEQAVTDEVTTRDEAWCEAFRADLGEQAAYAKQQFFQQGGARYVNTR